MEIIYEKIVNIPINLAALEGELIIPDAAVGVVLFAHGSGSSRHSPRNKFVAKELRESRLATLLIDLLTGEEESRDIYTGEFRFNIELLAERLVAATDWLINNEQTKDLKIGYFGASTGAAAALIAATRRSDKIFAVVSRGGRPDLAAPVLSAATTPTLLIVGGRDDIVIGLNESAKQNMKAETRLEIVPGATHLFEEPGALEKVAGLAAAWFIDHV